MSNFIRNEFQVKNFSLLGLLLSLLLLLSAWIVTPALAYDGSLAPPPGPQVIDRNFKNLSTGGWDWYGPSISIGVQGQGGLSYQAYSGEGTNGGWANDKSWLGSLQYIDPILGDNHIWATLRGQVEEFTDNGGGSYTPTNGTGGTLTKSGTTWTYTTAQGTVVTYTYYSAISCGYYCTYGLPTTVAYANGEVQSYTWRSQYSIFVLMSVTNNYGYQLKLNYDCSSPTTSACYIQVDSIMAINNGVEYCSPTATSCSPVNTWPTLTMDYSGPGVYGGVTDNLSNRWYNTATSTTIGGTTYVEYVHHMPNGQYMQYDWSCNMGCFDSPYPETVTDGTNTWDYNYSTDYATYFISDVTDPNSNLREVTSDPVSGDVQSDINDPSGINVGTTWTFNANNTISNVSLPNSDYYWYDYDGRGNETDNYGYGQRPYHLTAHFPSSCTYQVNCNKPDYTLDANNNETDYTYDNTYGVMLTSEGPADNNGHRPLTTYSYTLEYAWYMNSSSTIVQAATPIYMLTGTTTCMSSTNSCTGTSDQRVNSITYEAGSGSVESNLKTLTTTVAAGDASVSATTTLAYDSTGYGLLSSVEDPDSNTTVYFYDGDSRKIGAVQPDPDGGGPLLNPATRTTYNQVGQVTEVEQGTTPSQTLYDFQNNYTSLVQASTAYDSTTGLKAQDSVAIGGTTQSVTQYSYWGATNLECTAVRQNSSVFGSLPGACSLSTTGSYGDDQITQNNYDAVNRLTSVVQGYASGSPITSLTNDYNGNGQLDWVEDANGNRTGYTYDGNNRLYKMFMPDPSTAHTTNPSDYEQYGYDDQANMTTKQLRDGNSFTMYYDALNRIYRRQDPITSSNDIYYNYDLVNDPLYVHYASTGGSGIDYTWNAIGQKLTEDSYGHTITSQYDAVGNRTCLEYPDGQYIKYSYDPLNRMQEVDQNGSSACGSGSPSMLATYSYDNLGRMAGISRGNSTSTSTSYDSTDQNWTLSQDLYGSSQDVTLTMDYSPAGQTVTRSMNNSAYGYTVPSSANTYYCANGLNQYSQVASSSPCTGGTTYSYADSRGNLTSDGSRNFTYDLDNELTGVSGSASASIDYDPVGRLKDSTMSSTTENYVYDGAALVVEYDGSGNVLRRYVPGADTDETLVWYEGSNLATPNWLHTDEQGSVIAASNSSGVGTLYVYGPAGEPQGGFASGAPIFRYTGQAQMPAIGLYYYKARMYDPNLGRFLQTDPAGYSAGMNLYAYVMNDFANSTDPGGMDDDTCPQDLSGCTTVTVTGTSCGLGCQGLSSLSQSPAVTSGGGSTTIDTVVVYGAAAHQLTSTNGTNGNDPCPGAPAAPPGASLTQNMKTAKWLNSIFAPEGWAAAELPGGAYDYKASNGSQYTTFGNFNYGATCYFTGLSLSGCQRGAGAAAYATGAYSYLRGKGFTGGPGNPFGSPAMVNGVPDYGDQPGARENSAVIGGYNYAACRVQQGGP